MLFVIDRRNTDGTYRGGQDRVVHLVSKVGVAIQSCPDRGWAFSEGNAGAYYARFSNDLRQFDRYIETDRKADKRRFACSLGCLLLLMGSIVMAIDTQKVLFDFAGADAAKERQTVNDGVMGGVSEGEFKIAEQKTMEFFGTLSLQKNSGFASVRTKGKKLGLEKVDKLVVKIRGDGREYSLNRYPNRPLMAFFYRATVQTRKDE